MKLLLADKIKPNIDMFVNSKRCQITNSAVNLVN